MRLSRSSRQPQQPRLRAPSLAHRCCTPTLCSIVLRSPHFVTTLLSSVDQPPPHRSSFLTLCRSRLPWRLCLNSCSASAPAFSSRMVSEGLCAVHAAAAGMQRPHWLFCLRCAVSGSSCAQLLLLASNPAMLTHMQDVSTFSWQAYGACKQLRWKDDD